MTEQDDQWPESLRIMREQRERIAALEAEVERLRADLRTQNECIADQYDTIRGLRADAERYCKLRKLSVGALHVNWYGWVSMEALDQRVDQL